MLCGSARAQSSLSGAVVSQITTNPPPQSSLYCRLSLSIRNSHISVSRHNMACLTVIYDLPAELLKLAILSSIIGRLSIVDAYTKLHEFHLSA